MDFEWDSAKERVTLRKHGIDFRTAARIFLDPYMIEFDDLPASGELRFNAIGLVDDRMLFCHLYNAGRHSANHLCERSRAA